MKHSEFPHALARVLAAVVFWFVLLSCPVAVALDILEVWQR